MFESQKEGHYRLPVRLQHPETDLQQTKQFETNEIHENEFTPIVYGLVVVLAAKYTKSATKHAFFWESLYILYY